MTVNGTEYMNSRDICKLSFNLGRVLGDFLGRVNDGQENKKDYNFNLLRMQIVLENTTEKIRQLRPMRWRKIRETLLIFGSTLIQFVFVTEDGTLDQ